MHSLQAQYYICTATEYRPKVHIPQGPVHAADEHEERRGSQGVLDEHTTGQVFYYLCRFSVIASRILLVVRNTEGSKTPPPLAFALSQYDELLELMDGLPASMTRKAGADCGAVLDFQ